jgi:hypothetical protein
MNTFELNLSLVLGHTLVWESASLLREDGIAPGYFINGDSHAPSTQESTDAIMKAYGSNLLPLIQKQLEAAKIYEPEMQTLKESLSPRQNALDLKMYQDYGGKFAQVGSDIARQNAQAQAETDLGIVSGTGRELAREAMITQREADPEAYRARELALSQLEQLNKSLVNPDSGLSGSERTEIDRSLARDNFARGTGATPTATSTVGNALAFGQAGEARRGQRQSAIAQAAQLAAEAVQPLSSRVDTFQLTTGRPSVNTGETRQQPVQGVGEQSNQLGTNLFNNVSQTRQQENQINASRKTWIDRVTEGVGAVCCWTFAEAYYGWDNIPLEVCISRDEHYTPARREGYRRMSAWLIPKMRSSVIVRKLVMLALIKPMESHARWYVHRKGLGWIFAPLQKLYLNLWSHYGEQAGFDAKDCNLALDLGR